MTELIQEGDPWEGWAAFFIGTTAVVIFIAGIVKGFEDLYLGLGMMIVALVGMAVTAYLVSRANRRLEDND